MPAKANKTASGLTNPVLNPAADPVPGHLGHFDHHIWLKNSVQYLNAELTAQVTAISASVVANTTTLTQLHKVIDDWANELNALPSTATTADIVSELKKLAGHLSTP